MNVAELIAKLQQLDQSARVVVCGLDGYQYAGANECEPLRLTPVQSVCCEYADETKAAEMRKIGDEFAAVFIG